MVEVEMGKKYIGDVVRTIPCSFERADEGVVTVQVIKAEEPCILFVAHAIVDQNTPAVHLHEQAAHSPGAKVTFVGRSEEHTSELQSRENLVCRLLLEKKKK